MSNKNTKLFRWLAYKLSDSMLLRICKLCHENNPTSWKLPFKAKVMASLYVVIRDYGTGKFPPIYTKERLFADEVKYAETEGEVSEETLDKALRGPFEAGWNGWGGRLKSMVRVLKWLDIINIPQQSKCLEIGCGSGWLSEIICLCGHNVTATTLSAYDIQKVNLRSKSIAAKQVSVSLKGIVSPMEDVHSIVGEGVFSLVVCHGALHHSYDWGLTIDSVKRCLCAGGYFMICNEPSWHHTIMCYRTSRITGRHEVGISGRRLRRHLKNDGFSIIKTFREWNSPILGQWILCKKC